ncbi:MAG: bifunctional nuclease family protein [Flavobacteriaceae bacterium]
MDYKKLIIRGISYSQTQSGAYALLLEHPETGVKLPVVIGSFEAQSISMGLEKDLKPPRPLTHDLFAEFVENARYTLESVVIYKIVDGVFFSNINFVNRLLGDNITLDARTSDAVAMAVRFDAPVYTTKEVLNEAGILLNLDFHEEDNDDADEEPAYASSKSIQELQSELDDAVKNEDFDLAIKIQEEIKARNKKID